MRQLTKEILEQLEKGPGTTGELAKAMGSGQRIWFSPGCLKPATQAGLFDEP